MHSKHSCKQLKTFLALGFESPFSSLSLQAFFVAVLRVVVSYLEFKIAISAMALGVKPLLKCNVNMYWDALFVIGAQLILSVFLKTVAGYIGSRVRLKWRRKITQSVQRQLFSTPNLANYLVNLNHSVDNLDQRVCDDIEASTVLFWHIFLENWSKRDLSAREALL